MGHYGCHCICSCPGCSCNHIIHNNGTNLAIWGAEGSSPGAFSRSRPIDINPPSGAFARPSPSDSLQSIPSEQRAPILDTERSSFEALHMRHDQQTAMQRYLAEIDEDPWPHFLESRFSGHVSMTDTLNMEDAHVSLGESMLNSTVSSSGQKSLLSSGLRYSRHTQSPTASTILKEVGTSFGCQSEEGQALVSNPNREV